MFGLQNVGHFQVPVLFTRANNDDFLLPDGLLAAEVQTGDSYHL